MADYLDLQTIANDAAFRGRCRYAFEVQALYNMGNLQNISQPIVNFCNLITSGGWNDYQAALAVLSAGSVAGEATVASLPGCTTVSDQDILSAVAINFNALAGVPTFPGGGVI
jgi:hypothetical protein